jgi:hypothetical protein
MEMGIRNGHLAVGLFAWEEMLSLDESNKVIKYLVEILESFCSDTSDLRFH